MPPLKSNVWERKHIIKRYYRTKSKGRRSMRAKKIVAQRDVYHGNPLLEFFTFPRHSDGSNIVGAVRDCTVFALVQKTYLTKPDGLITRGNRVINLYHNGDRFYRTLLSRSSQHGVIHLTWRISNYSCTALVIKDFLFL